MEKLLTTLTLAAGLLVAGLPAQATDQAQNRTRAQDQIRDQDIYGHQMMTAQERGAHLGAMRAAKTAEERERIRKEHHEQMTVRAKERGVKLPDKPPAGRGPGSGPGPGSR